MIYPPDDDNSLHCGHIFTTSCLSPSSTHVGHQVWSFGGGRWKQVYFKNTTSSKRKAGYHALPGNYTTKSKSLVRPCLTLTLVISWRVRVCGIWRTWAALRQAKDTHTWLTPAQSYLLTSDPFSIRNHVINHTLWELHSRSQLSGGGCDYSVVTWTLHVNKEGWGNPAPPPSPPPFSPLDLGLGCRKHPSSPVAHESEGQTWHLPCSWPQQQRPEQDIRWR